MEKKEFYTDKADDTPRRIYRNLVQRLTECISPQDRLSCLEDFLSVVRQNHSKDEFLRMKLCLPPELTHLLTRGEYEGVEAALSELRSRRVKKLRPIYPVCSDEFAFEERFFRTAFRDEREQVFTRETRIFTIGSCFALNIARYLQARNYNVESYRRAEDINSVFGNALLFRLMLEDEDAIRDYILDSFTRMEMAEEKKLELVERELTSLKHLKGEITSSEVIIVTLGNIVDAFFESSVSREDYPRVFPRFFEFFQTFSVTGQANITSLLKAMGGTFRLGSLSESLSAVRQMFDALHALNPKSTIFATVSPVAINNVMGIGEYAKRGPIEADCVSKSTLRACLEDVLSACHDANIRYFPSFEIVRWLGSTTNQSAFGTEDAASQHVSDNVLNAIYGYFESLYGADEH